MKTRIFYLLFACLLVLVPNASANTRTPTLPAQTEPQLTKVSKFQRWVAKKIAKKIQKRIQKKQQKSGVREDSFWYFLLGISPIILGIWLIIKAFSLSSGFLAILVVLLAVGLVVVGSIFLADAIDIYRGR